MTKKFAFRSLRYSLRKNCGCLFCHVLLIFLLTLYGTALSVKAAELPEVWQVLSARLAKDGLSGPQVNNLLATLGSAPTQDPMGRKIRELYNRQFYPSPRKSPRKYYRNVLSQANAELCRQFIRENQQAFNSAQQKYGVPSAILAALLFVETRLGKVLGDVPENAFYTLASMSVTNKPENISNWLPKLPGYQKRRDWLLKTMKARADWAYNETRALIRHMIEHDIAPDRLPGSIYGAVGLCQFMPSNIAPYGADGDGDGRIDLFTRADSIASAANYLHKHGWNKNIPPDREHALLMTYNHSTVYANTILALSKLIENPRLAPPVSDEGAARKKGRNK